jgi:RNA polymerase sigma factor (TIGR02999 family)
VADPTRRVTHLLHELRAGNAGARGELWPLVYDELRRLAGREMRDQHHGHTLQATALVHEAYMRLVSTDLTGESRGEFFSLAARAMRSILVDHARGQAREKRGGGAVKLTLDEALLPAAASSEKVLELDDALGRLAQQDERKARAVELHFFGGLTYEEIADLLEVSLSTVRADMRFALAWLCAALDGERGAS